ncbi:MAG: hypothetical protein M1834_007009 [Cirrosporium novae-zelandiae]|nr:MAG: hypothetical protein M1834_007009 [Cirrosporium novae-zelandiae]
MEKSETYSSILQTEQLLTSAAKSPSVVHHGAVYRKSESSKTKHFVTIWLPLVAHIVLCILVALLVTLKLDGYMALAHKEQSRRQPNGHYVFRVSDITSLLSAATMIIDFFGGIWIGITTWRCAFILLENNGLKVKHLSEILGGLPPQKWPRGLEWLVTIVLLCILPQQFIEPLISGSVNWNAATTNGQPVQVQSGADSAASSDWYWYLAQETTRKIYARRAAGLASIAWSVSDAQETNNSSRNFLGGVSCRHVMSSRMPVNSTLMNATIPCIEIHNIIWPVGDVPSDVWEAASSNSQNLSLVGDSPFSYYQSGVAVLFSRAEPIWNTPGTVAINQSAQMAAFPEATIFRGNMTVIMLVDRQKTTNCKPIAGNAFGNSSYTTKHVQNLMNLGNAYDENCLTYGTVHFTAGVIHAPTSKYISAQVVEVDPNSKEPDGGRAYLSTENITTAIEPSIWTREALWLMPDIMTSIAVMNTSSIPTWENLDGYTATLIRHAYLANWDMLHAWFEQNDTTLMTALPAQQRLRASVSFVQLFSWLGVTFLLPLSGILIRYMQTKYCRRGMIVDNVAVLLTDPSGVVKKHPDMTGLSTITGKDKKMRPMVLEQVEKGEPRFRLSFKPK